MIPGRRRPGAAPGTAGARHLAAEAPVCFTTPI